MTDFQNLRGWLLAISSSLRPSHNLKLYFVLDLTLLYLYAFLPKKNTNILMKRSLLSQVILSFILKCHFVKVKKSDICIFCDYVKSFKCVQFACAAYLAWFRIANFQITDCLYLSVMNLQHNWCKVVNKDLTEQVTKKSNIELNWLKSDQLYFTN